MPVESATFIGQLDDSYPLQDDDVSQGDDHLRLLKATIQNTFPNFNKALTASVDELNFVNGVTAPIQVQMDGANTKFVQTDNGNQAILGELEVNHGVRVLANTVDPTDAYVINYQGIDRAGLVFDEANGIVSIIQRDAAGGDETILSLNNGAITVNGGPALLAQNASAGASGSFLDGGGNTVTVVDGLITDLGV